MPHPAPAVIAALVERLRTGLTVRVDDGSPQTDLDAPDAVGVGLSVEDLGRAVSGDTSYGLGDQQERFVLACLVQSWIGDADGLPKVRTRAFALLDEVQAVLAADPHLGGVCDWARVVRWSHRVVTADQGVLALLDIAVQVDATRQEM